MIEDQIVRSPEEIGASCVENTRVMAVGGWQKKNSSRGIIRDCRIAEEDRSAKEWLQTSTKGMAEREMTSSFRADRSEDGRTGRSPAKKRREREESSSRISGEYNLRVGGETLNTTKPEIQDGRRYR